MPCSSPIISVGQKQFLHYLMASHVLPLDMGWAEPVSPSPNPKPLGSYPNTRDPTSEEHMQFFLERVSLNNLFKV